LTLDAQLQTVVGLIDDLVNLVDTLSGTVIQVLEPIDGLLSTQSLITPIISSTLLELNPTGTSSLSGIQSLSP